LELRIALTVINQESEDDQEFDSDFRFLRSTRRENKCYFHRSISMFVITAPKIDSF